MPGRKEELLNEILRKEGIDHFNANHYSKAIRSFNEALRKLSDDKLALIWRSKCYAKMRKIRRAIDDVEAALHIDPLFKEGILQKADLLHQSGNYEMALVYYNRGTKNFPRAPEFKEGIKKAQKNSDRTGRRMKLTTSGDISLFTRKTPAPKKFTWDKKPATIKKNSRIVPSANFRTRLVHPLVHVHKAPSVGLTESRAPSTVTSMLAGSLESLAYEDRLIEESTEKDLLGELYEDKAYLEFLVGTEELMNNKKTPFGRGKVSEVAEDALSFLQERTQFWDSLGPLPPPHPTRLSRGRTKPGMSRLSHYTSTDSLATEKSFKSNSSWRSSDTTSTRRTKAGTGRTSYISRRGNAKVPPLPPNPAKMKFQFATYERDDDLPREMTEIPEEETVTKRESEEEMERQKEQAKKRGDETLVFITKEMEDIDKAYSKGQIDVCMKKATNCLDIVDRFTEDEIPTKDVVKATLYSCLGNCSMKTQQYEKALGYHRNDLLIGEQSNMPAIQSRALGNMGRVHVLMGKYNRALDLYNQKAPLCKTPHETAWLFHEIGNCFLMMRVFQYAHESGLKALKAATDADDKRLQLQTSVLAGVAEVNLTKYKEAYQHFEQALDLAKVLDDKKSQDAMTQALVDVNKKMVNKMKKKKTSKEALARDLSPQPFSVGNMTPASMAKPMSAKTNITVEG